MIARRVAEVATLAAILLAVGLGLGNGPLLVWALVVGGLVVGGLSIDPAGGMSATIATDRAHPRVGDLVFFRVDVSVRKGLGPVLVRVPLPDTFQLAGGRNLVLFWKGPGALRRRFAFRARAAKRGPVTVGAVTAHPMQPFRLRTGEPALLTRPLHFVVEPRVRKVARLRHLRGRGVTLQPAGDRARVGPSGSEFAEVRAYAPGDPFRSVNWKATARGSAGEDLSLMVNAYEPEGKKSVWLFLDAGAHMEVGSTRENALDHAIEGTLGVLHHFVSRGYRVGATLYHQPETQVFYPDVGSRQLRRLTEALATVTAHAGGEGLDSAVLRSRGFLLRERPLVLLVTRPEADAARTAAGLAELRALAGFGRGAPSLVLLAPTPILHTLEGGHHPLSAATLRLAARATYQGLRRQGVRVLDWDPAGTPLERLLVREMVVR